MYALKDSIFNVGDTQAAINNFIVGYEITIIYALRFTDLIVHSIPFCQNREARCTVFPIQLSGAVSATFSLRQTDSRIKQIDSTKDTTRDPRATEPRL